MASGAQIIVEIIKKLGIEVVFGLVGIPVVEILDEMVQNGIKFILFRNEQAASYAASLYGYLTGKPGVLLVVGGPGVVHACAGMLNSTVNRWPLLVLAGSTSSDETYKGGFQELDQVSYLSPNIKFAARPRSMDPLGFLIQKAYRIAANGVPGVSYIDLPADIIQANVSKEVAGETLLPVNNSVTTLGPHRFLADPDSIKKASLLIKNAKFPLIVIGKGASSDEAALETKRFVTDHQFAFLPTPMGKGIVSDDSILNTSSARSAVLRQADVVVLLGARLNWILHHGETPRFNKLVKFVQIDISSEDIGDNGAAQSYEYGLVGDLALTLKALSSDLGFFKAPPIDLKIHEISENNKMKLIKQEVVSEGLLDYKQVYKLIKDQLADLLERTVYVIEGANTMDIARLSFPSSTPKSRLDAGTNATMGVGMGYAIALKLANPDKLVLAIEGDSAFGFSAMELETIARYKLPMIIIVMNNSGVYHGTHKENYDKLLPSTALSLDVRYDLLAQSLGVHGYLCQNAKDIMKNMLLAISNYKNNKTTLLNILIEPGADKKLEFGWQNKKAKL